jgi:spore maturation protein CgeB
MKLLIIGFNQPGQMGHYLAAAARRLELDFDIMDAGEAEARSRVARSFHWRCRDKRPGRLDRFADRVLDSCGGRRRDLVLTTGRAPLDRLHIEKLHQLGSTVVNYSTDDPWNPVLRASWFLAALPAYDAIFTPRRANIGDFLRSGVRIVEYLPFAYDPDVHRPWREDAPAAAPSDILFVGGCDSDRLPLISVLIDAGLNVALFGGYWGRHAKTRPYWRGIADQDTIRAASAATRVCLCMGRRANRDGHAMRSFEAAAIGGCVLAEESADHRELFGPDNQAVRYFRTPAELVEGAKFLVANANERCRLAAALRDRLVLGRHTYTDRLAAILGVLGEPIAKLSVGVSS